MASKTHAPAGNNCAVEPARSMGFLYTPDGWLPAVPTMRIRPLLHLPSGIRHRRQTGKSRSDVFCRSDQAFERHPCIKHNDANTGSPRQMGKNCRSESARDSTCCSNGIKHLRWATSGLQQSGGKRNRRRRSHVTSVLREHALQTTGKVLGSTTQTGSFEYPNAQPAASIVGWSAQASRRSRLADPRFHLLHGECGEAGSRIVEKLRWSAGGCGNVGRLGT